MQGHDQKEQDTAKLNRRKFLMRAGLGSLPILMSLKSKGAWGSDSLNCSLSQTASVASSVNPNDFSSCAKTMDSHGSAKMYFRSGKEGTAGGKGSFFYKYPAPKGKKPQTTSTWDKTWNGIEIHQDTSFNAIFFSGYNGTLADAVNNGPTSLIRNITALFLHSLYYQLTFTTTNIPAPQDIIDAYVQAITPLQQQQLTALLEYYIDGKQYPY